MKTINITFNDENIEDLLHILLIYETDCLLKDQVMMHDVAQSLRKYIKQCSN